MKPLFVYGTLMEGAGLGGLLGACVRRPALMRGRLFRLPAGYPALQVGPDGLVHGELVELSDASLLSVIDAYEGVDQGLYRREVHAALVGVRPTPAWVYVMPDPAAAGGRTIPSGRWKALGRTRV